MSRLTNTQRVWGPSGTLALFPVSQPLGAKLHDPENPGHGKAAPHKAARQPDAVTLANRKANRVNMSTAEAERFDRDHYVTLKHDRMFPASRGWRKY